MIKCTCLTNARYLAFLLRLVSISTIRTWSAAAASDPPGWPTISLTTLTSSVDQPVYVTHAGDGSDRIFIVERGGKIRIFKNGLLQTVPFLDITSRVESGYAEQGLLSVGFPPSY